LPSWQAWSARDPLTELMSPELKGLGLVALLINGVPLRRAFGADGSRDRRGR